MPLVPLTLVTGASSGIGREIAIQLSASRSVLIHGRDQLRLNETLAVCVKKTNLLFRSLFTVPAFLLSEELD